MEVNYEKMLEMVTEHLHTFAKTETVIGAQFKLGEYTCVPLMRVGMGFGSGGGGESKKGESGGGAGAGIGMAPMGFLVTRGEEIAMVTAGKSKGLAAMFEKIPDVLEKLVDQQSEKMGSKKEEKVPAVAE